MKRKRNKQVFVAVILAATCMILGIGGISAYLTDSGSKLNTFTVGKVFIQLIEPDFEVPESLVPEQNIPKNPIIVNSDADLTENEEGEISLEPTASVESTTTDAYVFMQVTIPKKSIITYGSSKEKIPAGDPVQLFQLNDSNHTTYTGTDTVNSGWTLLSQDKSGDDCNVYTYVYGTETECTALPKDVRTSELFSSVTYCNAVEGQDLSRTIQEIQVNAYAIQTKDIGANDSKNPSNVWQVLSTQLTEPEEPAGDETE